MENTTFTKEWWNEVLELNLNDLEEDSSTPASMGSGNGWQDYILKNEDKIEKAAYFFNLPIPDLRYAFAGASEVVLSDDMWSKLENSDSYKVKSLDEAIQHALKVGIDPKPYIDFIKTGKEMPLPLVLCYAQDKYYLVGGDVILSLYRALGAIPTILLGVLNLKINEDLGKPNKDDKSATIKEFLKFAVQKLEIKQAPKKLTLSSNTAEARERKTFGTFNPNNGTIWVYIKNRNMADILRTLAHELVHRKQDEDGRIDNVSGETGSEIENEANALAGVLLREFGQLHDNIYEGLKKNVINELGDSFKNNYKWKFDSKDDDGNLFYSFSTPQNKYSVGISYEGDDSYDVSFNTVGEMGLDTNENVAMRVISTVTEILLDFIKRESPAEISIKPITTGEKNDEKRFRVYGAYLKKNIPPIYNLLTLGSTYKIIKK